MRKHILGDLKSVAAWTLKLRNCCTYMKVVCPTVIVNVMCPNCFLKENI